MSKIFQNKSQFVEGYSCPLKNISMNDFKYMISGDWAKEAGTLLMNNRRKKDILIVKLEGELDHHHADDIRNALDKQLDDTSIRNLILDLSNLYFMDSSGIGVFIGRYKTIRERNGQVCITNINAQLERMLEVSGLYRILKVYDTVQDAIKGIRGKTQ